MHRDRVDRDLGGEERHQRLNLARNADADRVADRKLVAAHLHELETDLEHVLRAFTSSPNGEPKAVEIYPRTQQPSSLAARTTSRNVASDSSIVMLMLRFVNRSDAAVKTAIASAPAAARVRSL